MEYTAQNLEYAVSVFYHGEQEERAKAHAWLTGAQRVPEAWTFVWLLLQPNKGTEIQFYAATTLHTKILRCWNEIPPESYEELQQKILEAIATYSKGPKLVTNRLCISLAAFILQQGTTDLATILRPLSTMENTSLLLEVLTVIPEEYNSMTMGSVLRSKNRAALQQACPAVLDDMLRYLSTVYNDYSQEPPSEEVVVSWLTAATCATSWLSLGGEDSCDSVTALPDRVPLCRALMTAVHVLYTCNEAVSDSALDACEACLAGVRAAGAAGDAARYSTTALQLLTELAALAAPVFNRDNVPNSINEELLSAVITCAVAVGECHAAVIVKAVEGREGVGTEHAGGVRRLLEVLLAAQAAPGHYPIHETRSNLTFGFWYTLQDEVLNVCESGRETHGAWREVFSRVLAALVVKSQAPPEAALSRDDHELLRCYRQDIADAVMYCYAILGEWCWESVEAAYSAAAEGSGGEARREAALHVLLALADAAPHERAPDPLLRMLEHAVRVVDTATDTRTLNTALDCLGSYAAWLSSVQDARGCALGRECVRAAGAALHRSAPAAARALRKLAADCSAPAALLADNIVTAAQSEASLRDSWVRRQLLGAAGSALAAAHPATAAPLLLSLAHTLRDELTAQAETARLASAADSAAALVSALGAQPALLASLLRIVLPTLPRYALHPDLVEPMFHILKQTVATLLDDCLPLAGDVSHLTLAGLETKPCAQGLDVVKLIVLALGADWSESSRLLQVAVRSAAQAVAADPSGQSDLTEALFHLLHTITKKKPQYLDWIEDLLAELVDLAIGCVRVWEARSARYACTWMSALAVARPAAMRAAAPALTVAAVRCIGGCTPRNQIEPLAEVLLSLNRASWTHGEDVDGAGVAGAGSLGAWLRTALAPRGFPTQHATDAHKQQFINAVLREKSSKRRLLDAVQEFSLVCRGLIGTEYARQMLASKQLVA